MLIIFDLDDTLIDCFGSLSPVQLSKALDAMIEAGLEVDSREGAFNQLLQFNQTSLSGRSAIRKFLEQMDLNGQQDYFWEIGMKEYYTNNWVEVSVKPLTGAQFVLGKLKEKNKLALVSRGDLNQQTKKMIKAGLNPGLFDAISVTEDLNKKGFNKKKAYQTLIHQFGVSPAEVLVCGDKVRTDLLPAQELGMKTVHMLWGRGKLYSKEDYMVDFKIERLDQITGIVKKMGGLRCKQ